MQSFPEIFKLLYWRYPNAKEVGLIFAKFLNAIMFQSMLNVLRWQYYFLYSKIIKEFAL